MSVEAAKEVGSSGGDGFSDAVLPGNEGLDGATAGDVAAEADGSEQAVEGVEAEQGAEGEAEKNGTAEGAEAEGGEAAAAAAAKPAKVWADQFKTPEDLEIAYRHSSVEGKRLAKMVKEQEAAHASALSAAQDRIAELEIQAELGPEIKEPTEDELEKMGPVKSMLHLQKISERKALAASLKGRTEQRKAEAKKAEAQLKAHHDMAWDEMERDAEHFPDFNDLKPVMKSILDLEPGVAGFPNSPLIAFLAAYGRRALGKRGELAKKEAGSKAAAKAKAGAGAAAAGAAGSGASKEPISTKKAPAADSDEAVNNGLEAAYNRRHANIF